MNEGNQLLVDACASAAKVTQLKIDTNVDD